ncbi:DUF924 family protein [Ramlibacter sp. MMS24-I3-19]|uniref:DUF924 family protein n=1 Tax=Ramlibacter sp. MMS24-I3-19 TaxID=3416606 RepID=UPI003D0497A6
MNSPATIAEPAEVLRFWTEAGPKRWFRKDAGFDAEFRARFLASHEAAARGDLAAWTHAGDSCLALLVLLDQFPRNAFRDSARAWSTDALARVVARQALARGLDRQASSDDLRNFFYLPFMHSEWLPDQQRALDLTRGLDGEQPRFAQVHHDIVKRFGRFPHRNALLGRRTTHEEQAFLEGGGFAG